MAETKKKKKPRHTYVRPPSKAEMEADEKAYNLRKAAKKKKPRHTYVRPPSKAEMEADEKAYNLRKAAKKKKPRHTYVRPPNKAEMAEGEKAYNLRKSVPGAMNTHTSLKAKAAKLMKNKAMLKRLGLAGATAAAVYSYLKSRESKKAPVKKEGTITRRVSPSRKKTVAKKAMRKKTSAKKVMRRKAPESSPAEMKVHGQRKKAGSKMLKVPAMKKEGQIKVPKMRRKKKK